MLGNLDDPDEQKTFEKPAEEHSAIGKHADGGFSGESLGSASEGGAKGGLELDPRRRPRDEEAGRIGPRVACPMIVRLMIVVLTIVVLTIIVLTIIVLTIEFGNGNDFWHVWSVLLLGDLY